MEKKSPKNKIDELLKQLEAAREDTEKVDILGNLSTELLYSNPEKAKKYAEEGLEIGRAIGYKIGITNCLLKIGIVYHEQGDHAKAMEYYQKSLEMFEEMGDKHGISGCLKNIGTVHKLQGNYPQALEFHHKSLEIDEELGDNSGISTCLNNIGIVHWSQRDPQALEYYHKSLKKFEELGNKRGISGCFNNIGVFYGDRGDYPQALEYYHKSMGIYEELGDKKGIATSQLNIGMLNTKIKEIQKALNYLTEGLNLAKGIGALDLEMYACLFLSEIYEKSRKYKKALEYYKLHKETNDKLFNEEKSKQIAEMQTKYEMEKKEQEIQIWRKASVTDLLTKLMNRQGLWEKIKSEINRFARNGKPFVLSIADIDGFKLFNDEHGHDCGDSVLEAFANVLKTSIREQDHVGRWGGEEFLLILPETDLADGLKVVEKVRKNIEDYSHNYNGKNHSITASFGISEYRGEKDIDMAIKEADKALYAAKMRGKNCCATAGGK